jgi:uncharacterized protein (TIGR00369 family)
MPPEQVPAGYAAIDLGKGYSAAFGPVFIDRAGQRVAFRVAEQHGNPVDTCHGGALATFADAQIVAVHEGAEAGKPHTPTITLTVDYLVGIPVGALVEAQVTLVKATRTMLFTQSLMTVDGAIVARSSAIYRNAKQ